MIRLTSVVLPAPLGPITPEDLAALQVEVHVGDRDAARRSGASRDRLEGRSAALTPVRAEGPGEVSSARTGATLRTSSARPLGHEQDGEVTMTEPDQEARPGCTSWVDSTSEVEGE